MSFSYFIQETPEPTMSFSYFIQETPEPTGSATLVFPGNAYLSRKRLFIEEMFIYPGNTYLSCYPGVMPPGRTKEGREETSRKL